MIECPEGIEQLDICRTIFIDGKIRVLHTSTLARMVHKAVNGAWGGAILFKGYEDIVFSKTLPGTAMGLALQRPGSIITISTIIGISLSFCETITPWAPGKLMLSTVSWAFLIPAKVGEILLNQIGGMAVGVPVVSKMVSRLKLGDIKLNFTQQITHGPGASISDFKEGLACASKVLSHFKKD